MTTSQDSGKKRTIFVRATILSAAVAFLTILSFIIGIVPHQRTLLKTNLEERARILAASLQRITPSLANEEFEEVAEECMTMVNSSKQVLYAGVSRRSDGMSIMASANQSTGKANWTTEFLTGHWTPGAQTTLIEVRESEGAEERVLNLTQPIFYKSVPYGWVHVGLSVRDLEANSGRVGLMIGGMAVPSLLLGIAFSFAFAQRLTKPISLLREFAVEIASGNLDSEVEVKSNDELGLLAQTMNQMTIDLKRSRDDVAEAAQHEARLQQEARMHETLLKEIHHRVKNNMQILSSLMRMQRRTSTSDEVRSVLLDGETRVRSMGLIHEKLYQSKLLSQVDLGNYLETLISQLIALLGVEHTNVRFEMEATKVLLGLDTALPCGLIANEIVSNSLKYAFPDNATGCIRVRLNEIEDGFQLEIGDDGVGLPPQSERRTDSLGMSLIDMLIDQLDGTLDISSAPDAGTTYRFTFKESQYANRI